jgi:hypothetical protein
MARQALAISFLATLLASPTFTAGQTVGTATGSIIGVARDATSALLPNVKITISSDALMGTQNDVYWCRRAISDIRSAAWGVQAFILVARLPDAGV